MVERRDSSCSMESYWRSDKWSGEKTAGQTQSGLTFQISTSASIRPSLYGKGPLSYVIKACLLCVVKMAEGLDITLDNPAGLCRWILMDNWI